MAKIDVSELMTDPDFTDTVTLIQRSVSVTGQGETALVETPRTMKMIVQSASDPQVLTRMPDGARLADVISVYSSVPLHTERAGGYADVLLWKGQRYQVRDVPGDFTNWGKGYTLAYCLLESAHV